MFELKRTLNVKNNSFTETIYSHKCLDTVKGYLNLVILKNSDLRTWEHGDSRVLARNKHNGEVIGLYQIEFKEV